jgi:hypothetical protein
MLGLLVLWGSLSLIFTAHHRSDDFWRLEAPRAASRQDKAGPGILAQLDPGAQILLPFSLHQHASARRTMRELAAGLGWTVHEATLSRLSERPATLRFDDRPMYEILRQILALSAPAAPGLAVHDHELELYPQKLTKTGGDLEWRAAGLPLSAQPLLILPGAPGDIWLTVTLSDGAEPRVQAEAWRGSQRLGAGAAPLDADRGTQLALSHAPEVRLALRPMNPAAQPGAGRYDLQFFVRSAQ